MIVSVGRYDLLILTVSKIEEGNQLTVFVVVADLVLASLVSGSMDSPQKKLCIHHGWQDNVTLASISVSSVAIWSLMQ